MSILHFCMIDPSYMSMPLLLGKTSYPYSSCVQNLSNSSIGAVPLHNLNNQNYVSSNTNLSVASSSTSNSNANNMSSMVGNAISVIPGTTLINNLFGRVFTSGDHSGVLQFLINFLGNLFTFF